MRTIESERYAETGKQSFFEDYLYDTVIPKEHFFRKLRELIDWYRFKKN